MEKALFILLYLTVGEIIALATGSEGVSTVFAVVFWFPLLIVAAAVGMIILAASAGIMIAAAVAAAAEAIKEKMEGRNER